VTQGSTVAAIIGRSDMRRAQGPITEAAPTSLPTLTYDTHSSLFLVAVTVSATTDYNLPTKHEPKHKQTHLIITISTATYLQKP